MNLRALEPHDIDQLFQWENDSSAWLCSDHHHPISRAVLNQYIADSLISDPVQSGQLRMMIDTESHETVGCADLYDIDQRNRHAKVGILIAPDQRGKGYALQALRLLSNLACQHLLLRQLYATVQATNKPSLNLFNAAGYTVCGTLKDYYILPPQSHTSPTEVVQRADYAYDDAIIMALNLNHQP